MATVGGPPPGRFWQAGPVVLARGTTIGGWEVVRAVAEIPWPEAKAERVDGTMARLTVLPAASAPTAAELIAWRAALAPATLDHPGFPAVRGLGHDPERGVVWIARVWSPWSTYATIATGHPPLAIGRRGAALVSLGSAIAALHAVGVAHGGLAAARVLLSRADGSACEVLDLGLDVVAAGLGLPPPWPTADGDGATADLRGFAAIVDQVLDEPVRRVAPWRSLLDAWLVRARSATAATRTMAEAVAALIALLPPPAPPEVVPPLAPPSVEEQARIDAAELARMDAARARAEALDRAAMRPRRRTTGPQEPAFVAPIVIGGPAVDPDIWPWMLRARRPTAIFTYDPATGALVTGPVTWQLGAGQRVAAADAIADAIARALDALVGPRGPGDLEAELGAAGFIECVAWAEPGVRTGEARPRGTRWWQGPGLRALVTGARVTLQRERRRWATKHQIATVGEDLIHLATADLPREAASRRELLGAALAVIALVDQRPNLTHICRFCHGSFDALSFHVQLGACHACAEQHLR